MGMPISLSFFWIVAQLSRAPATTEVTYDPATHQPPRAAAGLRRRSQRHILDLRSISAGGGHFVECRCRATRKHADADTAIAEWRRVNRPARVRRTPEPAIVDNVVQMRLPGLAAGNAA
jgi:hypothetical protein